MTSRRMDRADFWTQFEIALYIQTCVDCGKEINIEIVEEWNKLARKGKEEHEETDFRKSN